MKIPIYFDYSSTTPVDLRVAKKMMQCLTLNGIFGNPSSLSHIYGWKSGEVVDIARNQIANMIGASANEIIFTSGATESNNLAIKGAAFKNCKKGKNIITSVIEHKSVINTCKQLEIEGFNVTWLTPSIEGVIAPQQLKNAIRNDTIIVSLMHVNNETGLIQDIVSFGKICNKKNILFHVDASQSIGKLPVNLSKLPIDLMSLSSHKLYGPKGIGALFIRNKSLFKITTQIHGGYQEMGVRSGTLPVHQIVGMGEAYYIASKLIKSEMERISKFKKLFWKGLKNIDGISLNGNLKKSISTIININFKNKKNYDLILAFKNLAVSTASACNKINFQPSYVLNAMGLNKNNSHSSIRFSLGRFTTFEEINYAIIYINKIIKNINFN